jgi:hypothetical protein
MRVIRNYNRISHLAVVAGGVGWASLPGLAAGSSLRQVTAADTEAREKAGALNFSGMAPVLQVVEISMPRHLSVPPAGVASRGLGNGQRVAWSGAGYVLSAVAGNSGWLLGNSVIVEKKPRG